MPRYDYICPRNDTLLENVYFPLSKFQERIFDWCPAHGHQFFELVIRPTAIEDWGNEGTDGRWFEHLSPQGLKFRDKRSYREHLRKEGLQEWAPRRGMPGQEV